MNNSIRLVPHYLIATHGSDDPYVMFDNVTKKYYGYSIDFLHKFKQHFNFTYEIYAVEETTSNVYDILYKEILDKKADMLLHNSHTMHPLEDEIHLTKPVYEATGFSIMMYNPGYSLKYFKFLETFETNVWMSILVLYFVNSILLAIFNKWSPYSYRNNKANIQGTKNDFTLIESIWFCIINLTPQGRGELPENLSGRFIAIIWWLFGNFVLAFYAANLANFLTIPNLATKISSVEDLNNQQNIQYGVVINSSTYKYFQQISTVNEMFHNTVMGIIYDDNLTTLERLKFSTCTFPYSDKYSRIFKSMKMYGHVESFSAGIARLQKTDIPYALISETSKIKYFMLGKCEFMLVGEEFAPFQMSIVVRKKSPLIMKIDKALAHMFHLNELQNIADKWLNNDLCSINTANDYNKSISIRPNNIIGLFIITFSGVVLAYALLIVEIYLHRKGLKSQLDPGPKRINHLKAPTDASLEYLNSL